MASKADERNLNPPVSDETDYEQLIDDYTHFAPPHDGELLQGRVVKLHDKDVIVDFGYKSEGLVPIEQFTQPDGSVQVKVGDEIDVMVDRQGLQPEGYILLSHQKASRLRSWENLEKAQRDGLVVSGRVTGRIKGGLSVDVGVPAFMPGSQIDTRPTHNLDSLLGQDIPVKIVKLNRRRGNVVVSRKMAVEEEQHTRKSAALQVLEEGAVVTGTVKNLTDYGAFIDLGGIDGLLHVSDIAHSRIAKPEDALSIGQQLQLRILKIDPETRKISLGLKQLQPEPWDKAPERLAAGQRITGTVTRIADFGAFVEIEPGIEGLIHISEMTYGKKVRHPSDILKPGDRVDAVILSVKPEERRIALGLKQTLADPWIEAPSKFPAGTQIEGPVTKLMNFGAFVQVTDGIEGLVHISEISADKRINHPQDVLRVGQVVKAQVLAIDPEKRQIKLSIKQLIPSHIDEYIAEHKAGDRVSGRVVEQSATLAHVELGDGIRAICRTAFATPSQAPSATKAAPALEPLPAGKPDLSSLGSMLKARWKGSAPAAQSKPEPFSEGQIRAFKIVKLDPEAKKIEVELA